MNKLLCKSIFSLFFFCILFCTSSLGFAAACCGGGFAAPSIITGDDKAQLTTSFNYSRIDTDVLANGIWQKRANQDQTQTFKIEGAHIFQDRFQAGFALPIQMRNVEGAQGGSTGGSSSGLADVSLQTGYEFLPDWDYHPIRPKGVGYLALTLPTGKSIYESTTGLDVRGRGFTALSLGSVFTKNWLTWDASLTLEVHQAFEKAVNNSQVNGTIRPGAGGSANFGAGYNLQNLRIGGGITWAQEDPINVTGTNPTSGSLQRFATGTLSASYLFENSWAGTFSYSDQTLFGDPTNTSLAKSATLFVQKRWAR